RCIEGYCVWHNIEFWYTLLALFTLLVYPLRAFLSLSSLAGLYEGVFFLQGLRYFLVLTSQNKILFTLLLSYMQFP
ncbi:hypothetical protein ACJX0J_021991, partial [Zea mays]